MLTINLTNPFLRLAIIKDSKTAAKVKTKIRKFWATDICQLYGCEMNKELNVKN